MCKGVSPFPLELCFMYRSILSWTHAESELRPYPGGATKLAALLNAIKQTYDALNYYKLNLKNRFKKYP